MARITRRLKVYTTRIGIRDWAIAAANQKEALKAWDVRENLFATGAARETNDATAIELAMETPGVPVALPGKLRMPEEPSGRRESKREARDGQEREPASVIRLDEHRRKKSPNVVELETRRKEKQRERPRPPPSPPDRSKLDAAEEALAEFEKETKERRKELEKKKRALDLELESFASETGRQRERLEKRVEKERDAFDLERSSR
jgi:colicin import membrane protein